MDAGQAQTPPESPSPSPPPLDEAARSIAAAGKAFGKELLAAIGSLRRLMAAELALSRSAALRMLALAAVAAVFGVCALAFGLALAAIGLVALGLPWWGALAILALVSLLGAGICVWLALRAFEDTTFKATRRQLARLHLADDPDEVERDPEAMP